MSDLKINGYQIYNSFVSGFIHIDSEREDINSINVFPVADGDTGNNLVRTIKIIVYKLEPQRSAYKVLETIANLSLNSARGNSGLILSQFLNGLALNISNKEVVTIGEFSAAASKASKLAYEAVENPVEGTILTIISAWSKALNELQNEFTTLEQLFLNALNRAKEALNNTKNQLEILKKNDVIDAGAMGFVSFLKGVNRAFNTHHRNITFNNSISENVKEQHNHTLSKDIFFRFCTEFLLDNKDNNIEYKKLLSDYGDSIVVSKGLSRVRLHVHTNNPNLVLRKLEKTGTIIEQKVEDMIRQEQVINSKKSNIAILTDSIADIPRDILDNQQIHVVNLHLLWGNNDYIDRLTITPEEFYKDQSLRDDFPSSSIPTEGDVESVFNYLLEHYNGIIALPVGKSLSGTWNVMSNVAKKYNIKEKKVSVIDTCLNSVAQGLLVDSVAKKANEGVSLEELEKFADEIKKRIKIYVSVNTFEYMVKGGRVSPLKGRIATLLNLKPIVSLDKNGKGAALDKAFSRDGLVKKIVNIIKKTETEKGVLDYAIVHAEDIDGAELFSNSIEKELGRKPKYITDISSIVGMHSGKGALAIGVIEGN